MILNVGRTRAQKAFLQVLRSARNITNKTFLPHNRTFSRKLSIPDNCDKWHWQTFNRWTKIVSTSYENGPIHQATLSHRFDFEKENLLYSFYSPYIEIFNIYSFRIPNNLSISLYIKWYVCACCVHFINCLWAMLYNYY